METLDALRTKRAVRQYKDQPVSESIIREIVNAGRYAQSSKNSQPWEFIVLRNRETLRQLAPCGKHSEHLAEATFAIAIVSSVEWAFDIGQTAAYLQLAAWDLGIGSCIAKIHDPSRAKAILSIPEDRYLEIVISFGYPTDQPTTIKRDGRRALNEVLRWEHW